LDADRDADRPACPCCRGVDDPVEIDLRAGLPDQVLDLSPDELRTRTGGDDHLMWAVPWGFFARALMRVALSGGSSLTVAVWLHVSEGDWQHASRVWGRAGYAGLRLRGAVSNNVRPFGIRGAPACAEVRHPGQLPYLARSDDPRLAPVLADEWDRDDVLSHIRYMLPVTIRTRIDAGWSIRRTAGLASWRADDGLHLETAGRQVVVGAAASPGGTLSPPRHAAGRLAEHHGGERREAAWGDAGADVETRYELAGLVARAGSAVHLWCGWDAPDDLHWALDTWRSIRHEPDA
jgi:hypothetical protein